MSAVARNSSGLLLLFIDALYLRGDLYNCSPLEKSSEMLHLIGILVRSVYMNILAAFVGV